MAESASGTILKATATAYVLRGLTLLSAYLAQKGLRADHVLTPENLAVLAGAAVVAGVDVSVLVYRKIQARNLIKTALAMPQGSSVKLLNDVVATDVWVQPQDTKTDVAEKVAEAEIKKLEVK